MFSASLLLGIRWYLFKDGFSKAHQPNYTVKGEMFLLSVVLHDYIIIIIQSWMYSLICTQPGGGDDPEIKEIKALVYMQSMCSRSMILLTICPYHTSIHHSFRLTMIL